MHPYYEGCLARYEIGKADFYCLPTFGYLSLSGVFFALLHAINYDCMQKGLPPLTADALDSTFLTTIPKYDWTMPLIGHYLVFGIR